MRILNNLVIDPSSVTAIALVQNSTVQEMEHMGFGDVMCTIAAANPANKTFAPGDVDTTAETITITAHGFITGMLFTLTTTGGLPTGLSTATNYYVIKVDANTIKVASSQANALAGTAIDLTTVGTGTQTVVVTTTLAGTVKLQKNDEPINPPKDPIWFDIASSSQAFSGATTLNWELANTGFVSLRVVVTVTSGTVTARARVNAKGF